MARDPRTLDYNPDAHIGQIWQLKHDPRKRIELTHAQPGAQGQTVWFVRSLNTGAVGTVAEPDLALYWQPQLQANGE